MSDLVDELSVVDEALSSRLHERLVRDASEVGTLSISYRTVDSPIGTLLLATTSAGLVRVAFENEPEDLVLQELSSKLSPAILYNPKGLDEVARELDEYFKGTRRVFEIPLDFGLSRGFRRTVIERMVKVPFGNTRTYSQLAVEAGNPKATRAVGSACATNPIPIVLPCHRILRSDGSLGGYRGGLDAKRFLLALETK
ncbi:MAG: methylated-DNA--[protein]-cysteine S-methyltransferase [Cryobacterium sp.]|nr:methylated-DNA--[protein]-cysteine S-methyltransferase [Cryobacterium sp.]